MREGYKLVWEDGPPALSRVPLIDSTPSHSGKLQAMGELVESLLAKEVIEEVHAGTPVFYRRFFLVLKKEQGVWHAILDLSTLNKFMRQEKFQMETAVQISPDKRTASARRVGDIGGYDRRLPLCADASRTWEISVVPFSWNYLPLQSVGYGAHFFTTHFYQNQQVSLQISSVQVNLSASVFG